MARPERKDRAKSKREGKWGIDLDYEDAFGAKHAASQETLDAVLKAMAVDPDEESAEGSDEVMVIQQGSRPKLKRAAAIVLESGSGVTVRDRLPQNLPIGYHQLQYEGSTKPTRLIVSPKTCYLPKDLNTWGWAVQLYAARSRSSWGIGDFADLERLAKWSASELGAGMLLMNPLSAATPIKPQQPSPYYPASRRFFNPLWIHIEWIPGATPDLVPKLEECAKAGRELNSVRLIDRDKIFDLKMKALEILWSGFQGNEAFDAFCEQQGDDLHRFGTFCALAEHFQSGWHAWPEQYRHPASPDVRVFGEEKRNRVEFHKWLQWLLDMQLQRCSEQVALMQDLPIGVDPDGADSWAWQDVFSTGASVGAPPDEFNTQGQNWGLPPYIPHRLRAAGYEPFIQTIRAAFRHGGGLRIDHVMGLFRLFWIPTEMPAAKGTYVRYNADEMLSIVALESVRAGAYVVGEDLGTVEPEMREKLAKRHILSYRLLWFEKEDPCTYPREALAAITTHDLPTVAGLWTGSDLRKQRELDLNPNEESTLEICSRLTSTAKLEEDSPIEEVISRAYDLLARAPARILTAALDDAAAVEERPNVPATMSDKNPNWMLALPQPIEKLMSAPLPQRIARSLRERRPSDEAHLAHERSATIHLGHSHDSQTAEKRGPGPEAQHSAS